jgi:DNA-binding protein HU-beta
MSETSASTVMLKGIFEQLAQDQNVPKKQAQELLTGMVERVTSHLRQRDRIRINGLGTLEVRKREARTGRNPATGETLQIAPSKVAGLHQNRCSRLQESDRPQRDPLSDHARSCYYQQQVCLGAGSCHERTVDEDRLRPYIHFDFCGLE